MKAQQRHSHRGPTGERNKTPKDKEKKEAAGKAKEDKVRTLFAVVMEAGPPVQFVQELQLCLLSAGEGSEAV